MKARFSILLSFVLAATAFAAPIPPGIPYTLEETRGQANVERTFDRIGIIQLEVQCDPEEAPVIDFLRKHDVVDTTVNFHPTGSQPKAHFLALSPADRQAFFDLLAAGSWTREPDTPEGFQVFVPPSAPFRYYIAAVDGKTAFAKDPDALRAALDLYPSLPDRLPAEGDIAFQFGGEAVSRTSFLSPSLVTLARRHIDTLAAGVGTDADTLSIHTVLAPRTASQLAAHLRSCGPIPPSTACVNLPGATSFFAEGPAPSPSSALSGSAGVPPAFLSALARRTGNQPFSAAFYPPATPPGAFPRILVFQGINDLPTARSALRSLFARHSDAFALVSAPSHRDIPVDTLYASDPEAIADLLEKHFGHNRHNPEARALILRSFANGRRGLTFAWLPEGLLVSLNDNGDTLLHAAIDAALDGTATPFGQPPAFPAAFPEADGPAHALARLDLPTIAPLLPSPFDSICRQVPASCPVDLFACVTPDASLVIRLRAPLSLPQAFAHPKSQGTQKSGPVK